MASCSERFLNQGVFRNYPLNKTKCQALTFAILTESNKSLAPFYFLVYFKR